MSQTKAEIIRDTIIDLVDKVLAREDFPKSGQSYADLGWIKFYAKEMVGDCKDCGTPSGSKNETKD